MSCPGTYIACPKYCKYHEAHYVTMKSFHRVIPSHCSVQYWLDHVFGKKCEMEGGRMRYSYLTIRFTFRLQEEKNQIAVENHAGTNRKFIMQE